LALARWDRENQARFWVDHDAGGVAASQGWHYRGLYVTDTVLKDICGQPAPYFRDSVVKDTALADRLVRAHLAREMRAARLAREILFITGLAGLLERHGG
jgi:hypothetical protein